MHRSVIIARKRDRIAHRVNEYDKGHHCSNPDIESDKYPFAIDSIPRRISPPIAAPQTAKPTTYAINQQAQSRTRKQQHPTVAPYMCSIEDDAENH